MFAKASRELRGMKSVKNRVIDIEIRQGLNERDLMLVARLVSDSEIC